MTILLDEAEIRMVDAMTKKFIAAQERVNTIMELNEEYMSVLRAKYNLDETWQCSDMLKGFEKAEAQHDKND
jgi:hypothetical protein